MGGRDDGVAEEGEIGACRAKLGWRRCDGQVVMRWGGGDYDEV
jgi:hypothetical protein